MKTKLFGIIIIVLVFFVFSCNKKYNGADFSDDNKPSLTYSTVDTIPVSPSDPTGASSIEDPADESQTEQEIAFPEEGKPDPSDPNENIIVQPEVKYTEAEMIMSVDDIKYFNIKTGEIVFADFIINKFSTKIDTIYTNIVLYYNDKPLFEDIIICWPHFSYRYPGCIVLDLHLLEYDEVLKKATYEYVLHNKSTTLQLNEAWDTLIKYLNDSGKIIN